MFSTTSDMLHQIYSLIEEGYTKESRRDLDFSSIKKVLYDASDSVHKNYAPFFKKDESRKIEERVVLLEQHNEQLVHIVHFLFERFAEVARNLFYFQDNLQENTGQDNFGSMPEKERKNFCEYSEKDPPALTKREMDVFALLTKGMCAKEIAKMLFISEATVITHKRNLKEKFKARNTVELISNVLTKKSEHYVSREAAFRKK